MVGNSVDNPGNEKVDRCRGLFTEVEISREIIPMYMYKEKSHLRVTCPATFEDSALRAQSGRPAAQLL